MQFNKIFIIDVYLKLRDKLPRYVLQATKRLIPYYFLGSVFEMFGLVVLFPVIQIIIEPDYIKTNQYVNKLFVWTGMENVITFVLFLFTAITLIFVLKNIIIYFILYKQNKVSFNLASKIAFEKFNYYINMPYDFHVDNNSAVLLRNFSQVPFELLIYVVVPFIAMVNEFFILGLIVLVLTVYNPSLFLSLMIFLLPFLYIYNRFYKKRLKYISDQRNEQSLYISKMGIQSLEAYREMTLFNKRGFFTPLIKSAIEKYSDSIGAIYRMNGYTPKIVETVAIAGIFLIFLFGYLLNMNLAMLAQFLIVFAIAAYRVIPSMNKIILYTNHIKSSAYLLDYFNKEENEFIARIKPEEKDSKIEPLQFKSKINISNLKFRFPGKSYNVLDNVNLEIHRGKTYGIIGSSGAGKTTLLNVILRLFSESEGGIYVDEVKITDENLKSWYKLVSYVPQNITLLDGSIEENIAFGISSEKVDKGRLKEVIEHSQLGNFIDSLPEGARTQIGEKGIKISGGQRQRIGIARALYHGGDIIIFDEATSSLDIETERMLTESIAHISAKTTKTILIVAHRLQTLEYCDEIYKLDKGRITESTTYSQLIKDSSNP